MAIETASMHIIAEMNPFEDISSEYTQGTELGLKGLAALAERIQKVFGSDFEWVKCSEMAERYVETLG
jgi:hypothetical protein